MSGPFMDPLEVSCPLCGQVLRRCSIELCQQVSLRAMRERSGEETGPGLGICCSLPILPMQTDTQHGGLEQSADAPGYSG